MTTLWLMCVDGIESRWSVRLDVDASMIWLFDSAEVDKSGTRACRGSASFQWQATFAAGPSVLLQRGVAAEGVCLKPDSVSSLETFPATVM